MNHRVEAKMSEVARHQRDRAGAIDIVIAEEGDPLPAVDGVGETRGGDIHVEKARWVRHQLADHRLQEAVGRVGADSTSSDDAGENLADPAALADGCSRAAPRVIQPVDPGTAGDRALDIEEEATVKRSGARHGRSRLSGRGRR